MNDGPTDSELEERIALIRRNIVDLVEQAAAYSGAGDEARTADRIAQQEHWRQALAVRTGSQPPVDPDGHALESIRAGVRFYRLERRLETYDGRTSMVTRRLRKSIVDGSWDAERIVENVESVA